MQTRDYQFRHAWDDRLGLAHGSVERIVHGSESWRQAQRGAVSETDYWQDVAAQLRLTADQLDALQQDYFAGDVLDASIISMIHKLHADGHAIALLSNEVRSLRGKLDALGIADLFNPLVISAEIGVMKPAAEAYNAVLSRLQRPASETIFIDDMPVNIDAANALGIHGVLYRAGMDLETALTPVLEV